MESIPTQASGFSSVRSTRLGVLWKEGEAVILIEKQGIQISIIENTVVRSRKHRFEEEQQVEVMLNGGKFVNGNSVMTLREAEARLLQYPGFAQQWFTGEGPTFANQVSVQLCEFFRSKDACGAGAGSQQELALA